MTENTPNPDELVTFTTTDAAETVTNDNALVEYPIRYDATYQDILSMLRRKPLRPDQINWSRNQRKLRKNRRRAHAAGAKNAFK